MDPYSVDILWMVIVGFIIAFILAFAVGANDVANSFATSVGSGVLTYKQAFILGTIFEVAGAILLGYKVSDTIRKGIIDIELYEGDENTLMYGMLATLIGSAAWLLIATWLSLPVSTTHSIVGSTVGFSLVARGMKGISLVTLGTIASSWIISPVMSGLISVAIYMIIHRFIINADSPLKAGLVALPIVYAITIFINALSITFDGSKLLYMENLPLWMVFTISTVTAIIIAVIVQIFIVPRQRRKIIESSAPLTEKPIVISTLENGIASSVTSVNTVASDMPVVKYTDAESEEHVNKLFSFLQILASIFSSFAHGGNDVSNAISPLVSIWLIYSQGSVHQKAETPILILLYGGIGIVIGLWTFGRRVIETVGNNLTKITPPTGFTIENGAAATVLVASKIGVPISTTHCKVGSVVFVGWFYGKLNGVEKGTKSVDWSLFRSIAYAWVITLPAAAGFSALCMWIFTFFV